MSSGGEHDSLAPVTPLFGRVTEHTSSVGPAESQWHATWVGDTEPVGSSASARAVSDEEPVDDDVSNEIALAEKTLLKKLRARSLSVREARIVVAGHDLDSATVDELIEVFLQRGYLDDAALADQLVYTAVDRKGQGRQVIAQTLAKRGVPRDIADAAIAALPDDDADRALEFARGKARSLATVDRDTAVRRLTGQLARRGYPGSVALNAARQALDEVGAASGVRFR